MTWSAMVHGAKSNVLRNWMQWWQKKHYIGSMFDSEDFHLQLNRKHKTLSHDIWWLQISIVSKFSDLMICQWYVLLHSPCTFSCSFCVAIQPRSSELSAPILAEHVVNCTGNLPERFCRSGWWLTSTPTNSEDIFEKPTWFQDWWRSPLPFLLVRFIMAPYLAAFWELPHRSFHYGVFGMVQFGLFNQARRFHSPYVRRVLWISNHLPQKKPTILSEDDGGEGCNYLLRRVS